MPYMASNVRRDRETGAKDRTPGRPTTAHPCQQLSCHWIRGTIAREVLMMTTPPEGAFTTTEPNSDASRLHVSVITDLGELTELAPQWTRLVAISPHMTAYNTPVAALTWFHWFSAATDGVYAILVWRGNELVGLAPFSVTRMPLPWKGLQLLCTPGAEHGYYGEPLLGSEPKAVAKAIAEHIAGLVQRGTTMVHFRRIASDGFLTRAICERSDMSCHRTQRHTRGVVRFDLVEDGDAYVARLGHKHKIPRLMRRLAGDFAHVEYLPHDPHPDAALNDMRDMVVRRFGHGEGPEIFSSPVYEAFMRRLTSELIDTGHARVSSLTADDRRIFVSLDFYVNDHAHFYTTAYEPGLAKYSLGKILMFEALRYARESGANHADMGSATFAYKQEWGNATADYDSFYLGAQGVRGDVAKLFNRATLSYRARRIYNTRHDPARLGM